MFRLVCDGVMDLPPGFDETEILAHIAQAFWHANARDVQISRGSVCFTTSLFGVMNGLEYSVLVPFESGELSVDLLSHQLCYHVSFRRYFVATTLVMALGGVLSWLKSDDRTLVLTAGVFFWISSIASSAVWGNWRFRRYLVRSIDILDD